MEMTPVAVSSLAALLERATGQQLVAGRRWRIETALAPVMRAHGIETLDALAAQAGGDDGCELEHAVVEAMLNHETSFFRDLASFRAFVDVGLGAVVQRRADEKRVRIWSAGCSTGQETYSLVLALRRQVDRWKGWDVGILGTDVSRTAIAQAREGLYSQFEIQRGLPVTDMVTCFDPEGESWRVKPALRQTVKFRQHNLLDAPPAGEFDVILCRNVLLYFSPERQREVFARLAEAIAPGGLLMLGAGETVMGQTDLFIADPELRGLYRRAD